MNGDLKAKQNNFHEELQTNLYGIKITLQMITEHFQQMQNITQFTHGVLKQIIIFWFEQVHDGMW